MVTTTKVGEFRPHYTMGEPDYDEPFDIIDSAGGYLGQCGLELNDPLGAATIRPPRCKSGCGILTIRIPRSRC